MIPTRSDPPVTGAAVKTALYAPPVEPDIERWREKIRHIDASELTALSVSDHFLASRQDSIAALAALAACTDRVRLMALVPCNDYRHPVLTHEAAATIDVLSAGLLVGTVEECTEQLLERRERLGLNYVDFGATGFAEVAPLIHELAGIRDPAGSS
ncbi:LLM class flavin-dependent oxidoreductase [Rhodococcus triatomae]|uniref:Luciferase-like monooxygenase n=1 Tax=Rhodococcus triatomae TaxID=300028 RepID=A0A1G8BB16_9NOCA|nr:LLM class flavin-dependent oxidoreductase [Rhodococcus triatomae]QNG17474.1 LLM class flavin-dependent oxidoreductase [Rhodococcus triatomae]QNG22858.1 LLM class flavin-dependent oxidoreductase [Rhodococcus triatomae]SDH30442.1 Luciferase-like monooxygenase [Rhodococcus triatomae]